MDKDQRDANGWHRDKLTLRLSNRRSAALRELVAGNAGATPTDAIDLAIDLALDARHLARQDGGFISRKQNEIGANEGCAPCPVAFDADSIAARVAAMLGAQLDEMVVAVAGIRADLADVRAALPGGETEPDRRSRAEGEIKDNSPEHSTGARPEDPSALSLSDWIVAETSPLGIARPRSAVVSGVVLTATPTDPGFVHLVLDARLLGVDKAKAPSASRASGNLALLVSITDEGAPALSVGAQVCLWCADEAGAWSVKVHSLIEEGGIGPLIATARGRGA